jgi:hypothetical protein
VNKEFITLIKKNHSPDRVMEMSIPCCRYGSGERKCWELWCCVSFKRPHVLMDYFLRSLRHGTKYPSKAALPYQAGLCHKLIPKAE